MVMVIAERVRRIQGADQWFGCESSKGPRRRVDNAGWNSMARKLCS